MDFKVVETTKKYKVEIDKNYEIKECNVIYNSDDRYKNSAYNRYDITEIKDKTDDITENKLICSCYVRQNARNQTIDMDNMVE